MAGRRWDHVTAPSVWSRDKKKNSAEKKLTARLITIGLQVRSHVQRPDGTRKTHGVVGTKATGLAWPEWITGLLVLMLYCISWPNGDS